jgi:hypothetical protein
MVALTKTAEKLRDGIELDLGRHRGNFDSGKKAGRPVVYANQLTVHNDPNKPNGR